MLVSSLGSRDQVLVGCHASLTLLYARKRRKSGSASRSGGQLETDGEVHLMRVDEGQHSAHHTRFVWAGHRAHPHQTVVAHWKTDGVAIALGARRQVADLGHQEQSRFENS